MRVFDNIGNVIACGVLLIVVLAMMVCAWIAEKAVATWTYGENEHEW